MDSEIDGKREREREQEQHPSLPQQPTLASATSTHDLHAQHSLAATLSATQPSPRRRGRNVRWGHGCDEWRDATWCWGLGGLRNRVARQTVDGAVWRAEAARAAGHRRRPRVRSRSCRFSPCSSPYGQFPFALTEISACELVHSQSSRIDPNWHHLSHAVILDSVWIAETLLLQETPDFDNYARSSFCNSRSMCSNRTQPAVP